MARRMVASLAGFLVALAVLVAVEYLGSRFLSPKVASAMVLADWFLATFTGSSVALRWHGDRRRARPAMLVSIGLLGAATTHLAAMRYPAWSWIATMAAILAGAWLASRWWLARAPKGGPPRQTAPM